MGAHKYNQNCQLAREGLLPPKQKPMGKAEIERFLMREIEQKLKASVLRSIMQFPAFERLR